MKNSIFYVASLSLFAIPNVVCADIQNDINVQGFSGLINVPTGNTINYGEFHASYFNLVDTLNGRFGPADQQYNDGNVFNLFFSPFPGLELGMRNIGDDLNKGSDLSSNIKYSPTFIPKDWFSVAIGMQDIGGETNDLDSTFISVSKEIGDFRFTIGNGTQHKKVSSAGKVRDTKVYRYEGTFGGIEYQPVDWMSLAVENDGANSAAAIKFYSPKRWLNNQGQFYSTIVVNHDYDDDENNDLYFGVGFRTSLFSSIDREIDAKNYKQSQLASSLDWLFSDNDYKSYTPIDIDEDKYVHQDDKLINIIGIIKHKISQQGFENVWLGLDDKRLYVRLENPVFNRNDIDALGVVLGILCKMAPSSLVDNIDLTLTQYDTPLFRAAFELNQLLSFYKGDSSILTATPMLAKYKERGDMLWIGGSKTPYFVPRFTLKPVLANFVGTELGVLDYSLALRTNMTLPIWSGASLSVDYDINLNESDKFSDGQAFDPWSYDDGFKNIFLRQVISSPSYIPTDLTAAVSIGRTQGTHDIEYDVVAGEGRWQSANGNHRLSVYGALYESTNFNYSKEFYTSEYRYYHQGLDTSFYAEAGQFWKEDRGFKIGATTNFGDTRVNIYFNDTDVKVLGLQISVPLTPRKDMKPNLLQIKGAESWSYGLGTRIQTGLGVNPLAPMRAHRPDYLNVLNSEYFNQDRLSLAYLLSNAQRMRNAYSEFSQ